MLLIDTKTFHPEQWHAWFAWRPVFTPDGLVWWEMVERRVEYSAYDNFWYYRRIQPYVGN